MKNLTIVLLAIILFSCGNKKAEIVERIKAYKDSSVKVSAQIFQLTIDDTKKYEDLFWTNGEPDYNKVTDKQLKKIYNDYHAKNYGQKWDLEFKKARFKGLIDSLELELKKY